MAEKKPKPPKKPKQPKKPKGEGVAAKLTKFFK